MKKFNVFIAGVIAGAALSILFAPKKGKETRKILTRPTMSKIEEVRQYIRENSPTGRS